VTGTRLVRVRSARHLARMTGSTPTDNEAYRFPVSVKGVVLRD
jgi:hypothetical protein